VWIARQGIDVPRKGLPKLRVSTRLRPVVGEIPDFKGHASVSRKCLPKRHLILDWVGGENCEHYAICLSKSIQRSP